MIRNFFSRIGCLMLFFGTIILIVGIAIAQSGETPRDFFIYGSVLVVTGFILYARLRSRASRMRRTSIFRRRERPSAQIEEPPWENHFHD